MYIQQFKSAIQRQCLNRRQIKSNHGLKQFLSNFGLLFILSLMFIGGCSENNGQQAADPHDFSYDAQLKQYVVNGTIIPEVEVKRNASKALCHLCHEDAITDFKDTIHYKIAGRSDRVMFPGGGAHGMLDRACGLPGTSGLINFTSNENLGECAKCHAGRYLPVMEGMFEGMFSAMGLPEPRKQASDIMESGIDCLVCHADIYKSVPEGDNLVVSVHAPVDGASPTPLGYAKAAHDNSDFDQDGNPDLQIDTDGDSIPDMPLMMDTDNDGNPDTPWPTVAQDRSVAAVKSTGATNQATCLRCHEHARTGYKRATLFEEGYDVHATVKTGPFENAENQCTVCHMVDKHKFVRGHSVGGDLAAADYPAPPPGTENDPDDPTNIMCTTCHRIENLVDSATPEEPVNGKSASIHSTKHLDSMACETCHIPVSGGITYSVYGEGSHLSFGRNSGGKDSLLISADHMNAGDHDDIAGDFSAYQAPPVLVWFNGGTSFLAQTLAVRGSQNAKITPFKPMANGMVFDARFFKGEMIKNEADADYNAYSMYRFYANKSDSGVGNAEAFAAMDMLDLTPTEVRQVTLNDFFSTDPNKQAMAMMQIFPNMIHFDKATYGYEHYMISSDPKFAAWDQNKDGILDSDVPFNFSRFDASNAGLNSFKGMNAAMGMPAAYDWYPPFATTDDLVTMKLPDGSLMKMFLQMQASSLPAEQVPAFLAAVENYPAFSNGVTLGGHGVRPKEQAIGYGSEGCKSCHSADGMLTNPVPVTEKVAVDMGPMGVLEFPKYRWHFYNIHSLAKLGLTVEDDDIVAGLASVDIDSNINYMKVSDTSMTLNWFAPQFPGGYQAADTVLEDLNMKPEDLTKNGGSWMPVLEPITKAVPNYQVLGYTKDEIIWMGTGHGGGN